MNGGHNTRWGRIEIGATAKVPGASNNHLLLGNSVCQRIPDRFVRLPASRSLPGGLLWCYPKCDCLKPPLFWLKN